MPNFAKLASAASSRCYASSPARPPPAGDPARARLTSAVSSRTGVHPPPADQPVLLLLDRVNSPCCDASAPERTDLRPDWRDALLRRYRACGWRGFFTLLRLIRPDGLIRTRTRYGAVFALSPLDYIDGVVLRENYYESEVLEALRPFLAPGCVFWDVGANIGLHAISAAQLVPGLTVCAFEPNPRTLQRLRTNIAANPLSITVWPGALGEQQGHAQLTLFEGNSGQSLVGAPATAHASTVSVPLARADALIAEGKLPAPDVMKLDVEGYEANVLSGFGSLLGTSRLRAVVFESGPDTLLRPDTCPAARLLVAAGFRLSRLTRREKTTHLLENYLAVRS